jgi:hypothetical protein
MKRKMKHVNTFLALIAGLAFATTACVKVNEINEMYRPAGTPIVFSASSGYQNGIETRAEYSGFVTTDHLTGTTNNYERIDWEKDDPIKIVYNGTTAEFKVNNEITPENEVSKAGVVALGDPLYWTDATTHTFYGLYPNKNGASLSTAGVVSNCVIPKDQDVSTDHTITVGGITKFQPNTDDYGYMVAYKQISADDTDTTVELPFRPAVTTFEFKLQHVTGNADLKVTKFTLTTEAVSGSTTPLTGKFSLPITSGDKRGADIVIGDVSLVSGSTGNIIEVDMPEGGVTLPAAGATGYLDFSVIALPVDLTGISLNVYYEDGSHKTLKFQSGGNWVKFDGARKYLITNVDVPNGEWEYIIEPIPSIEFVGHNAVSDIPFNVKSYKRSKSNHDYKVEVKWHIEYSTDGNTYSESGGHPDFMLSGLPESASGSGNYTTGENRASNIIRPNPNHNDATSDADLISRQALQNARPKGTSASDCYDLSMFDVYGNPHAQTTANSYVVSAPGWYKFPVVYGNAITNGSDNKSAYDPYASDAPLKDHWNWVWGTYDASHHDVYMSKHFYNALNQPITSPYVLEDVPASSPKAVLIWQDTDAGDEIIKYDEGELELIGSGSNAYIRFHIAKENIHQGNIVLAVRDGNGGADQEVLWSWQIWVSEKDLTPITSKDLMPYNLGWVDKSGLTVQNYTNRVNYYRIVQDETGGTYKDFTITQIGDQNSIPNNNGYNTFYQWGRKDPITSAKLSGRTSQEYSAQLSTWTVEKIHFFPSTLPLYPNYNPPADGDYHSPSYALGIKRPWIPLHDPDNNGWVNGQFYPPLASFYHTDFLRGSKPNPYESGVSHDGAQFRKMSGCPFNLWNSYAYSSDDFSENKYKTVYDPCPPGFCVPSLGTFAGIESATLELDPGDTSSPLCNGINVIYSNGDSFFLPFSGTRGTRQVGTEIHYLVDDWGKRGVYWVDAPSALNKTNSWDSTNNNHGGGWWWYQFAKSLHVYYNIGSFPDEIDHTNYVKYSPEIGHWGAKAQTQKVGFDDVRSNAFSIRPVVDPMY